MARRLLALTALAASASALVAPQRSLCAAPRTATQQPRQLVILNEQEEQDGGRWKGSGGQVAPGGFNAEGEPPIKIKGFSLATAALASGTLITALAYAELLPVPVAYDGSEAKLEALFDAKANEAMKTVREDVCRHRYGDDAHLDTTTKALGLVEPGRPYPILLELKLGETSKGELQFSMIFNAPEAPFSLWADEKRVRKYATFFGPDVDAEVVKVDAEKRLVAIVLATNSGMPGGSGLKDAEGEVKLDLTAAMPEGVPARNRG